MNNHTITTNRQKLDALFDSIEIIRSLNSPQIEAQWAVYLCIRLSGLLETSVRSIYVSYCEGKSHPNIARHIGNNLNGSRSKNMNPENILSLVGSFNSEWRVKLDEFISENGRKDAIESVINIRNNVSHGGNQVVTYSRAKEYYGKIWETIEFMEMQCK